MLPAFEIYSVDATIEEATVNVFAEFFRVVRREVLNAVNQAEDFKCSGLVFCALHGGSLVRLPGSDLTHFIYKDKPVLAWTTPKIKRVSVTRVHLLFYMGQLEPVSEDTKQAIEESLKPDCGHS